MKKRFFITENRPTMVIIEEIIPASFLSSWTGMPMVGSIIIIDGRPANVTRVYSGGQVAIVYAKID